MSTPLRRLSSTPGSPLYPDRPQIQQRAAAQVFHHRDAALSPQLHQLRGGSLFRKAA